MAAAVELRSVSARAASALCAVLTSELPLWFGRPDANARYIRDIAKHDCTAAFVGDIALGLIALEWSDDSAPDCSIWWLGVAAAAHRQGLGRVLVAHAEDAARARGCQRLTVETVGPQQLDPNYANTRAFYSALGFVTQRSFDGIMIEMARPL
jgi:GNAT superfamily N-acetyltransferase